MELEYQLAEMAKQDKLYQESLHALQDQEDLFISIRNSLPPLQQKQLDRYISACEELDHRLMQLAYRLGAESK